MKKYDFIVVGAGISAATFCEEMLKHRPNSRILVIDKNDFIGGNCNTEIRDGIEIHRFGAHIFHTNDVRVIDRFADRLRPYKHTVVAIGDNDEMFQLPFNLSTFSQLAGRQIKPHEVKAFIDDDNSCIDTESPANFEEQAINIVGETCYELLIKQYTIKQWGRNPMDLPAEIIKRLPIRMNYDTTYFKNAKLEGQPILGYTQMITGMFDGCEVRLSTEYSDDLLEELDTNGRVIYCGPLDELFRYKHGELEYRSVYFETERFDVDNYQGNSVINDCRYDSTHTRTIEHKFFNDEKVQDLPYTYISKEYSVEYDRDFGACDDALTPSYPIGDEQNKNLHLLYETELITNRPNFIPLGRLATYRYLDMDKAIGEALDLVNIILNE